MARERFRTGAFRRLPWVSTKCAVMRFAPDWRTSVRPPVSASFRPFGCNLAVATSFPFVSRFSCAPATGRGQATLAYSSTASPRAAAAFAYEEVAGRTGSGAGHIEVAAPFPDGSNRFDTSPHLKKSTGLYGGLGMVYGFTVRPRATEARWLRGSKGRPNLGAGQVRVIGVSSVAWLMAAVRAGHLAFGRCRWQGQETSWRRAEAPPPS